MGKKPRTPRHPPPGGQKRRNRSTQRTFPSTLRSAVVKPVLKKASLDQNNLKNFRPVSNLSFMSKITEKVVLQQPLAYFTEHNIICPSQSAYRLRHSAETALLRITNDILPALDSGNVSLLTLLDLLPLTQWTTAYFLTDSSICMVSPVLHSPGFLLN